LLYPSKRAVELSPEYVATLGKPVTLIVPDGSWRQAAKVARREADLKDVAHVTLPNGKDSLYRLRREPKRGGLATFEAIARALGFLENKEVEVRLEGLFLTMVERTLNSRRGILTTESSS
jgi:DTW domain-containing protein